MRRALAVLVILALPFAAWAFAKPVRVLAPELQGLICELRICVDDSERRGAAKIQTRGGNMHAFAIAMVGALLMPVAASAQVKVIISGGFSGPYEKLIPEFQRASGIKVDTGSGASQGTGPQTIASQLA